jgi:hypothetical protein
LVSRPRLTNTEAKYFKLILDSWVILKVTVGYQPALAFFTHPLPSRNALTGKAGFAKNIANVDKKSARRKFK